MAQALPNGYCGLPAKQQRCPHANACLTCASFRTDETFLPHHERQLKATAEIIDNAKKCGWQRQAEMNLSILIASQKSLVYQNRGYIAPPKKIISWRRI